MIHVNSSKSSAMFSRRHREVIQTSVILILIVALGYGFYLYNLVQVKAEHLSLKSQRYQSQHQALSSQLQTVYEERSRLENSFQKEKLEHQNTKDELQEVKNQHFNNMKEQEKYHESQYKELHAQHERVKSELEEAKQTIEEVGNEKAFVELHKQQKIDRLNEMLGSKSTFEKELIDLKKDMEILSADHQQAKQQNADMRSTYNQSQKELMKYNKLKLILKEVGADTLQMGHPKLNQLNADNRKILFEHFGGSDNVMQMENLHQKAGEEQQQRLQAIQRQQEDKLRRDHELNARKQLSETSLLENDNHLDNQILGAQENSEQSQQQGGNSENDPQIEYNALPDELNEGKKNEPNTADIMGNQGDDSQVKGDTKIQEVHDVRNERSSQETTNKVLEELTTPKSSVSEIKEINHDGPVINSEHLNKNDVVDSDKNYHGDDQSHQNGIEQIESQAKAEEELARLELKEHATDIEDADNKLEKLKKLQIAQEQVVNAQGKQIDEYVKRNKDNHLGGDMDIRGQIFEEEDARLNDEIERKDDGDNDDEADEDDAQVDVPPAGRVAAQEPEMVVNAPKVNEGRDDTNHGEDEYEHYKGEQNQEEEENYSEDEPNRRQPARQVVNDQDQYDPDNDEEEQQAVDERHQAALEDADKKAYQKREM